MAFSRVLQNRTNNGGPADMIDYDDEDIDDLIFLITELN
jgi:hypothetical protein